MKEVLTREPGKEEREQAREGGRENALQFLIFKKIRTINEAFLCQRTSMFILQCEVYLLEQFKSGLQQ